MSNGQKILFWGGLLVVTGLMFHALHNILFPFIVAIIVAYIFDPLADFLESKGLSRLAATALITVTFIVSLLLFIVLFVPLLQSQIMDIIHRLPSLGDTLTGLAKRFLKFLSTIGLLTQEESNLQTAQQVIHKSINNNTDALIVFLENSVTSIARRTGAFISFLSLLVICPVACFYMLLKWDIMNRILRDLIPRSQLETVSEQIRLVDITISSFLRGQASVCAVLGIYYALLLSIIGLQGGLLVGICAGIISFIPYVGATVGLLMGLCLALMQFSDMSLIVWVVGVFLSGQVLESYVLTPRLVGDKIGLNDLWILFALLAGGQLYGFTGVLIAVPVLAVIGVLLRFWCARYRESAAYLDKS